MQGNVASTPHLRRIGGVVTILSMAAILFATLLPESGETVTSHLCLVCGSRGTVDVILNVLLFLPLGVGLALLGVPAKRGILMMCALSVLIETAQLLTIPGRDATIGDVLTNTLGGILGFAASRETRIWLRPTPGEATFFIVSWAGMWLAIQTISSFAFVPSIPESQYYGQLAPSLGNFAVFPGRVVTAGLEGIPIPNAAFDDSRDARLRLLHGATVTATVVAAETTREIAPIVRVADAEERELVLLAQNGTDLLFAIRSGAQALRLRPPLLALPQVFAKSALERRTIADTLGVSGRYVSREVRMSARTASETHRVRIPLTSSLGWTLVLPSQWFIEGTPAEQAVSGIWVACLVLPFGYWAPYAARHLWAQNASRVRAGLLWLAGLAVVYGGLVGAPYAFGLTATPFREWLAALAGLLMGTGLAARIGKPSEAARAR